jgi:hypothetical protein
MDNKLFLLLIIILLITIFIISIIIIVINNKNQNIEKFESNNIFASYMNYPRILLPNSNDRYNSIISYSPLDVSKIIPGGLNLSEKYDITASSSLNNLGINGYGTYYINSTFYINNPSDRNCISSLFNNRNLVTLRSASNNNIDNMISILYPERFQFKGIEIMLNTNAKIILENKIVLYSLFNSSPSKINTKANFNNNIITLSIVNINDSVIFDNTLYIVFDRRVNTLEILSIKIFGQPFNAINTIILNTSSALDNEDINIFSNNKFETLPNINTNIQYAINTNEDNTYQERPLNDKFKYLLANNRPPWGMYNAKNVLGNTLNDVFNRECKKATIEGGYEIITENIGLNNANITYIKGTPSTTITFPVGSLPEKYTICVMSKYTNPNTNRGRILTTKYPRNWLLGHWATRKTGVMYNDNWIYYENDTDNTTDWRISCAKSNATNYSYSLIINNINKGSINAGGNLDYSTVLKINGWSSHEASDFGLAYLIIWDVVLTDSELLLASQALTNYSITGQELNINNIQVTDSNYGTSRNNPGISALDIKIKTCTNVNGEYWIKNPITGYADKVYCIMDSECYGGGWMLAIKGTNKSGLFSYDGIEHELNGRNRNGKFNKINHWETNSTVQKDEPFNLDIDAKYDIFNHFKVTECLAIFNSSDTGGIINKQNYGWTWHEPKFYNANLSLKDFFATSRAQFTYYSNSDYDFVAGYNNGKELSKKYDPVYITRIPASNKDSFNEIIMNQKYTPKIWSRQDGFRAFGFNIIPIMHIWHKVRWGGIFNNESDINTSDVSGGIGLNNNWNAGNYYTCCESAPGAPLKQMGFKWFIK